MAAELISLFTFKNLKIWNSLNSFSIWHSDIGIPNYIKKLSGIVKIWSSVLYVAF